MDGKIVVDDDGRVVRTVSYSDSILCSCCANTEHPLQDSRRIHHGWEVRPCDRCGMRCDHKGCRTLPPNTNGAYGYIERQPNIFRRL